MRVAKGFTLIELLITILIISILAVTAISQLQDETGYGEYTYQARFISLARHVQTRAMQHTQTAGQCYQINFNTQSTPWFATPDLSSTYSDCNATSAHQWVNSDTQSFGATDTQEMADANLLMRFEDFNGNALGNTGIIRFDTLGRGYYQSVNASGIGTQCSNGCKLVFTGENNAAVCIEAEGYVHACQ